MISLLFRQGNMNSTNYTIQSTHNICQGNMVATENLVASLGLNARNDKACGEYWCDFSKFFTTRNFPCLSKSNGRNAKSPA
jgi:hypothetical protein